MENMPDEDAVARSVRRVEAPVMVGIEARRSRERRLRVGMTVLVAAALFAGGIAVGGAALAPSAARAPGRAGGSMPNAQGQVAASDFAVDCYTASTVGVRWWAEHEDSAATAPGRAEEKSDRADPTAICQALQRQADLTTALHREAKLLVTRGMKTGYITVKDNGTWTFNGSLAADGRLQITTLTKISDTGTALYQIGGTTSVVSHDRPLVACAVGDNWAAVYPRGHKSAQSVCSSFGHPVWGEK